jgi:hypothetical protein
MVQAHAQFTCICGSPAVIEGSLFYWVLPRKWQGGTWSYVLPLPSISYFSHCLSVYLSICLPIYPVLFVCMYVSMSVCLSVLQWSTGCCLSDFILSRLLRLQMLNSSAASPSHFLFPLRVVIVVVVVIFLLVTRSLFAWAIFYPPCLLLVHNVSAWCPIFPKLFVLPAFFLWWLHFLALVVWKSLQLFSKNQCLYLTVLSSNL